jgi:homoserine dehydrogenase
MRVLVVGAGGVGSAFVTIASRRKAIEHITSKLLCPCLHRSAIGEGVLAIPDCEREEHYTNNLEKILSN